MSVRGTIWSHSAIYTEKFTQKKGEKYIYIYIYIYIHVYLSGNYRFWLCKPRYEFDNRHYCNKYNMSEGLTHVKAVNSYLHVSVVFYIYYMHSVRKEINYTVHSMGKHSPKGFAFLYFNCIGCSMSGECTTKFVMHLDVFLHCLK